MKTIVFDKDYLSVLVSHSEGGIWSVFENSVLRKIFESKKDEVIGYWRKLHKKELYNV
jgi:hypothetical protein